MTDMLLDSGVSLQVGRVRHVSSVEMSVWSSARIQNTCQLNALQSFFFLFVLLVFYFACHTFVF